MKTIALQIPPNVVKSFRCYATKNKWRSNPCGISISYVVPSGPDDSRWANSILDRVAHGVAPSRKGLVEDLYRWRKWHGSEEAVAVLDDHTWAKVEAYCQHLGISAEDYCCTCILWHARLSGRREPKCESSFHRFEKALSREFREIVNRAKEVGEKLSEPEIAFG